METVEQKSLTFEEIQGWSGKEMVEQLKIRRDEINAVLAAKSAEIAAKNQEQNSRLSALEQAKIARQQEIEQQQEQAKKEREAEALRLSRLTPDELKAELQANAASQAEAEAAAQKEAIERQKDDAYLASLRPAELQAELQRREDEKLALLEQAEAEAAAEKQKEIEAKEQAEREAAAKAEAEAKAELEKRAQEKIEAEKEAARLTAPPAKTRVVVDYQATDDNGEPIGRPTHLEADSWEEMSKKQQEAHVNAVRYAERLKKRAAMKPTPAPAETPIHVLSVEEKATLEKQAQSAKEVEAELAKVKLAKDELNQERLKIQEQAEYNRQIVESQKFVASHPKDFYQCQANIDLLVNYMKTEKLYWSAENLEIAFANLESQLAPRPVEDAPAPSNPEPSAVPANTVVNEIKQDPPAANPPAAPVSVVAPVATPVVEQPAAAVAVAVAAQPSVASVPTPAESPAATVNPPATVRKLPAAGIEPGTTHGGRPQVGSKPAGLTKQDVAKMPLPEFKRRLKDPNFRKQLNAIGIKA
jgi:hypothetical protein